MKLPAFLKEHQKVAEEYISDKKVKDIIFSGPTYQIQIEDLNTKKDVWAFIQLDEKGWIRDSFCSCEVGERCEHIAAAYLYIYNNKSLPLHRRFAQSLWNKLAYLFAERMDFSIQGLTKMGKSLYVSKSVSGKKLFTIEGKNASSREKLVSLIDERPPETEETSIKFSSLPPEELALWQEGNPSQSLKYELSSWNDFAKWFMLLQEEGKPYEISFEYAPSGIPNWIDISFPDLEAGFYLSEANLPAIIPSLSTVDSPLKIFGVQEEKAISVVYDKTEGCLRVETTKQVKSKEVKDVAIKKGIPISGWLYVPKKGFYATGPQVLMSKQQIEGEDIAKAFDEYLSLIKRLLVGAEIYETPVAVSNQIYFDKEWNLHLESYLYEPGDLSKPYVRRFGKWVYVDDDGFYKIEGLRFDDLHTIIPKNQVSDFVNKNRAWLNLHDGFKIHLISIESQLTYKLDENNRLSFSSQVISKPSDDEHVDLDQWIYVRGEGFYLKNPSPLGMPRLAGMEVEPQAISLFIHINREELAHVPGFFSDKSPVEHTGVNIRLTPSGAISVSPEHDILPEYKKTKLQFFDEYVYVSGEGFHKLPFDPHLPEQYHHAVEISQNNQGIFLEYELPLLEPYALFIDPKLTKPTSIHLVAQGIDKIEASGQENWFSTKLFYHSNIGKVDILVLTKALKKRQRFVITDAGLFDLHDDRFHWLKHVMNRQMDRRKHTITLSTLDLLRLNAYEHIDPPDQKQKEYDNIRHMLRDITEFVIPEEPDFSGTNTTLRPYQLTGSRWLWFLYCQKLSGLLCDDMGLGKTHQAMALMSAAISHHLKETKEDSKIKPHFLVVCPTSVIYHWQDKLRTFFPNLRICTFYGSKRSLGDFHRDYDLLLTSYGVWRIEKDLLSKVPFDIAFFDEIQMAKNHKSQLHNSLLKVQARMRLGMTGTPIENHLRELKSLFDIVLPTYMPDEKEYREFFVVPIEKEQNRNRRELLSRYVKPFILRRKKSDVLLDLPEKEEEISYCALLPQQQQLYKSVLEGARNHIIPQLQNDTSPIPYVHVFAILTQLKRICDHPAVYLKEPGQYNLYQSGKWELFVELLNEARESEQKVVVFSQYLAQLDIIENYLKEHKIGFAGIRGSTVKRGEEVKRFQEDPKCEVFVSSLQAGGLGIDLTAASVVIHYDRWWNAARENQATDRVHRIGQKRGVQVFKFVTRGTFEEKIDAMITRKAKLMEDIIGADDEDVIKTLNRQEILELLRDVEIGKEDQQDLIIDQA